MSTEQRARRTRFEAPVLVTSLIIHAYLLGAALLLLAVSYPMLADAVQPALSQVHASLSRRLGWVFILPEFLAFFSVLPLFFVRSDRISSRAVWLCVALGVFYFVVTFGWHLPAHARLAKADASAMPQLLTSHSIRTMSIALKCVLLGWMTLGRFRLDKATSG